MSRTTRSFLVGTTLIIIVALGTVARFHRFTSPELDPDENWLVYLASGHGDVVMCAPYDTKLPPYRVDFADPATSWSKVMTGLTGVTHPPLFHLALRAWARTVGESTYRLRLFSGICSVLCIGAMFGVVRQRNGALAALLSAGFMACAWSQIEFSQQVRPYAFLVLLSLSCAGALQSVESAPRWFNVPWLSLSILAVCLTHYFAAGAVLAMTLYAIVMKRGSRRWATASILTGITAAVAVWSPFFLHSLGPFKKAYSEYGYAQSFHVWQDFLFAPSRLLLHDPSIYAVVPVDMLLVLAMVVGGRRSLLWSLWLFLSLGFVGACDLVHHSGLLAGLRYEMISVPAVVALLATMAKSPPRPIHLLLTVALLLGVASDGLNRSLGQDEAAKLIWYKSTSPQREGDMLVFRKVSNYPGSQPLDYIAYRRQHPNLNQPIMFSDK